MSEIEKLIEKLKGGIESGGLILTAGKVRGGRFREEINLELSVKGNAGQKHLCVAKVFKGRGYYIPWVEIFGINVRTLGLDFFGSPIEGTVLDLFGGVFPRIFIEYFEDRQTAGELKLGVPPLLSRLGFELGRRGYTLVRDWYIPEGLMEGGHKLQGEKGTDTSVNERRRRSLESEVEAFLVKCNRKELRDKVIKRFKILENLWREFSGTSLSS